MKLQSGLRRDDYLRSDEGIFLYNSDINDNGTHSDLAEISRERGQLPKSACMMIHITPSRVVHEE